MPEYKISREFNSAPYRLDIPKDELDAIELMYLDFLRVPKPRPEIDAYLLAAGITVPGQEAAMRMTVGSGLFLRARLVDNSWPQGERPVREWATPRGIEFLEAALGKVAKA